MPSSHTSRLRQELLTIRDRLAEGRAAVRSQHDIGMDGVTVGRKLTSLADEVICQLAETALEEFPKLVAARLRRNLVLVAHGGYGRRQMAPYSDVDMMILHRGRVDGDVERFAKRLTQDVFDANLQLGQSLRTVEEAVRLAQQDAVIATSLVESRPLHGAQPVLQDFKEKFQRAIQRRKATYCAAFVEARAEERNKYGDTVYLLEPNVKRSPGALRDLHLLRWLWFAQAGDSDLDRLQMRGVVSKFDHHRLVTSRDFLMRVRNELHFHAGKARDALTRDEQVRIAQKFGYYGSPGMLPVERFMRDYFRHAQHISFVATRLSALTQPAPTMDRVLGAVVGRTIEDDYRLGLREISATPQARMKLERNLVEAWRLVDLARLSDLRVAQDASYLVYRSAPNYSTQLTPEVIDRFLGILDNPYQLGPLLRQAHELGFLEKVIPEFSRARCLLQFNQYHKYTVDEHSIRAVEEATRFAHDKGRMGEAYASLKAKWLLHLTLLIHDLGKGREEDHSVLGERIAKETAERLCLPQEHREEMEFLVREHLTMNRFALRRDTSAQETVEKFAEKVQTPERLQLLYLVTCADMAAVGPNVLNKWRADMIGDLYERTLHLLRPEQREKAQLKREAMHQAVQDALESVERADPWFQRQHHALPESFIASHPPTVVVDSLRRMRSLASGRGDAWGMYNADLGAIELIAGVDQGGGRGVFANMAGALSAAGLKIIQAESSVLDQGMLLLRYVAQDPRFPGGAPEERIVALTKSMVDSIDATEPPKFQRVWGSQDAEDLAKLSPQSSEVRLDSTLMRQWLIIEVFTFDRTGLLYDLARTLHEMGLLIRFAKIGTSGDRVVDAFYVSERDESKPAGDERLGDIRRKLEGVIGVEE
ncbi:MAG: [protein-PII] uridylyltransferase [Planctomycetales bacterium]|nr:[protein-PII] uridylyltransferase [Planctomycetales bacterium]